MNRKKLILSFVAVMALALSLVAFAACSQPAQSTKSEEKLEASDHVVKEAPNEPYYVLLVGNDTRTGTSEITKAEYADGNARSDTMMLVRVDPTTYKITLVSVPRDTKDYLDGNPGKLNARYQVGGMTELLKGIEALTGVTPKYYINSTFVNFEDAVNRLGGISIYVPIDMSMADIVSGEQISYGAGEQDLDGAEALVFARERKKYGRMGYTSEEAIRQTNDRDIMATIINTILADPQTAPGLSKILLGFMDTNWDADEFESVVKDFADHADQVTILSGTGPYEGGIDDETGMWLAYRDEDTWHATIATVDDGRDPNEVIASPTL